MAVLDRKLITRMVNPQPGGNGGGGGYVPQSQAVSWTDINGKPTTLSGYGITDAYWATTQSTSDKRNLTIGSVTQQVITAHQSLSGYATEYWVGQQGYATQSWVGQQGYLTSSALSGYATQTWVGQQGYITSSGSCAYATSAGSAGSAGYAGYITDGTMDAIAERNNELNFGGSDGSSTIYFGYRARGSKGIPTSFVFGGGSGSATITCAKVYSNGGVTALSDARKKDVLGDVELSVDDIARMPAVRFRWKDLDQTGTFIGTLAQSWREILPEAVQPIGNNIGFDYNGAAIVAVVNLAKAVQKIIDKMNRYGFK